MKALLLLSGGIDSPVAGKMMKDVGLDIAAVHFSHEPFTTREAEEKSRKAADKLGFSPFISVPLGEHLAQITRLCSHKYYYVISRRMMLRVAERIANENGWKYLVTGDNLAQVGSQTLKNMGVISKAVKMLILRPLLANDKVETIAEAKRIGTYDISKGPEVCCVLGPKHPATRSNTAVILDEEKKLDLKKMVNDSVDSASNVR